MAAVTRQPKPLSSRTFLLAAVLVLVAAAIAVWRIVAAYVARFPELPAAGNWEKWGQLGDFFGGALNPTLAFSSFVLLLVTVWLQSIQVEAQQRELANSLEELEATRVELQRAADANSQLAAMQEAQSIYRTTSTELEALSRAGDALKASISELQTSMLPGDGSLLSSMRKQKQAVDSEILRISERLSRRRDSDCLSPTEVVRLWNEALNFGDLAFAEAHTVWNEEEADHFKVKGWNGVAGLSDHYKKNRTLQTSRAAFFGEYIRTDRPGEAIVRYETYYQDGRKWEWNDTLVLQDGRWKIIVSKVDLIKLRDN